MTLSRRGLVIAGPEVFEPDRDRGVEQCDGVVDDDHRCCAGAAVISSIT